MSLKGKKREQKSIYKRAKRSKRVYKYCGEVDSIKGGGVYKGKVER